MKSCRLSLLLVFVAAMSNAAAHAQSVQSLSPAAAVPGKTTEVIVQGAKLDEPLRVWTSLPMQVAVAQENVEAKGRTTVKLLVTVDAATPPQIGGLFITTAEGATEPITFTIDDIPSVADSGKNHTPAEAQELTLPAAVEGHTDGTQADHYKLNLSAGQRVSVEVLARRLGAELDPILHLIDPSGKTIIVADDDLSLGADGRFVYTATTAGMHSVSVRDVRYRGGAAMRYRMRVGDFPLVSTPHPLGITAGQSANLEAAGPNVANLAPTEIRTTATNRTQAVAFKTNGGQTSALGTLVTEPHPQAVEQEPNDSPETATKIALPCGINGRFHASKDRDQFTFDAKAGAHYRFRPIARSVGSPCYVQLAIFKPDGGLLAEAPVTEADEQPLVVTFPADGTYRLVIEDLLRRGGPEFAWHVEAAPFSGFGLQLKPDKNTPAKFGLPKNGAVSLEVQAVRQGYDGPITLSVDPADRGFMLLNNTIGEKQPATRVILIAPPGLNAGDAIGLRIVGTAERNGEKHSEPVSTSALIRLKEPQVAYPPAWLDGLLSVAVVNDAPDLFSITPSTPLVFYPRSAAQVGFTLVMDRKQGEFKDPLTILTENLLTGVSATIAREGNGPQEKYNVVLKAPKDVAEAKQDLRFQCYGEMKGQGRLLTVNVPLQVVTPLVATIAPEGPIAPGQKQKMKVSIVRFNPGSGEDKQPVTIKWKKLPAGVTAPGDAMIPADQTEIIAELSAAADAAVGPFQGVVVEATTKFQGVDVSVDSAPVNWEVK